MAEIDIQKKRKSPWPWILGGLAAALALWGIAKVAERPHRDTAEVVEERVQPPAEMPRGETPAPEARTREMGAIERFAATAAGFATAEASQLHTYLGGALGELGTVLHSAAAGTPHEGSVGRHLDGLRKAMGEIQRTPWTADTKANHVKSAFGAASGAMAELAKGQPQNTQFQMKTDAVREAADAIQGSQPVLDQRSGMQNFLTSSAKAVESLAGVQQPSGAQPTPGAAPSSGAQTSPETQPTPGGAEQPTGQRQR